MPDASAPKVGRLEKQLFDRNPGESRDPVFLFLKGLRKLDSSFRWNDEVFEAPSHQPGLCVPT